MATGKFSVGVVGRDPPAKSAPVDVKVCQMWKPVRTVLVDGRVVQGFVKRIKTLL